MREMLPNLLIAVLMTVGIIHRRSQENKKLNRILDLGDKPETTAKKHSFEDCELGDPAAFSQN